jgi:hypothetical protein
VSGAVRTSPVFLAFHFHQNSNRCFGDIVQCRPIGSVRLQDPTACLWVGFPAKFIIREEVRLLPLPLL